MQSYYEYFQYTQPNARCIENALELCISDGCFCRVDFVTILYQRNFFIVLFQPKPSRHPF